MRALRLAASGLPEALYLVRLEHAREAATEDYGGLEMSSAEFKKGIVEELEQKLKPMGAALQEVVMWAFEKGFRLGASAATLPAPETLTIPPELADGGYVPD